MEVGHSPLEVFGTQFVFPMDGIKIVVKKFVHNRKFQPFLQIWTSTSAQCATLTDTEPH